jgi:uncharacterized protein (TIGR03435 family)
MKHWLPILAAAAACSHAQAALEFEVASVKLTAHGRTPDGHSNSSINSRPGSFTATNASLKQLIVSAYGVKDYQVEGPDWIDSDAARYDLVAKPPAGAPSRQNDSMLQNLLTQRFKLAMHRETKSLPVYELLVAKGGPKMREAPAGENSRTNTRNGHMTAERVSMTDLADQLSRNLERAVIDKTGLKGAFDFTLEFAEDSSDTSRPSMFTALPEQLGLKLEATRAPIEVLVIDHAEKNPAGN